MKCVGVEWGGSGHRQVCMQHVSLAGRSRVCVRGFLHREKLHCSLPAQPQASGNTKALVTGNVLCRERQRLKKKSLVPVCDSKIFREMCTHYAAGILKQGTGTFIIQKVKQDVWRRQIDSWFVPSSLLYVIHHCQPCMLAAARGAAFLALPSGSCGRLGAEQG